MGHVVPIPGIDIRIPYQRIAGTSRRGIAAGGVVAGAVEPLIQEQRGSGEGGAGQERKQDRGLGNAKRAIGKKLRRHGFFRRVALSTVRTETPA